MKLNPTNTYWYHSSLWDYHNNRIRSLEDKIEKHKEKRAKHNAVLMENEEWLERWEDHIQETVIEEAKLRDERIARQEANKAKRQLKSKVRSAEEVKVTVKPSAVRKRARTQRQQRDTTTAASK